MTPDRNVITPNGAATAVVLLRAAASAARDVGARCSDASAKRPVSGSLRALELAEARATSGGGGVTRLRLLKETVSRCQVLHGHLVLLTDSVADCFIAASTRDGAINGPGLAAACRPVLELFALISWLLEDGIGAAERGRRLLVWQFHELRETRRGIDPNIATADHAIENLVAMEDETRRLAVAAQWATTDPLTKKGKPCPAALLTTGSTKEPEPMPSTSTLVERFAPGQYDLLSAVIHPSFLVILAGTKSTTEHNELRVGGIGLHPQHALLIVARALAASHGALAHWYGLDVGRFDGAVQDLTAMTWAEPAPASLT